MTGLAAQPLIDTLAKLDHQHEGDRAESEPLPPHRHVDSDPSEQADERGRNAEEYEIELRIDQDELRCKQCSTHNHPSPPRHTNLLLRTWFLLLSNHSSAKGARSLVRRCVAAIGR